MKFSASEIVSFSMCETLTQKSLEWTPSIELKITCSIRKKKSNIGCTANWENISFDLSYFCVL